MEKLFEILWFLDDVKAAFRKDPALKGKTFSWLEVFLYPGVHAMLFHRVSHFLHVLKVPMIPRIISQFSRFLTGIEIHPGARIRKGLFIDHGMGVVIGETTEIGENCLIYHQVTLGGTSLESGKRHPTLGNNVLIGAGAKLFGAISIGNNTQIGGATVVTCDVADNCVVVGNPGRVIRQDGIRIPSEEANQMNLPDPILKRIEEIEKKLEELSIS